MAPNDLHAHLLQIISQRALTSLFQPILDLQQGRVAGYEALIRGPSDSPLHSPLALFKAATHFDQMIALEEACFEINIAAFVAQRLPGRLFLNISPSSLLHPAFSTAAILGRFERVGLERALVVLEITEGSPTLDFEALVAVVGQLNSAGVEVAMDDLGEGFSSLRLWSELKPAYVKVDKHFISGIHQDPHKAQFVRSIQHIADTYGARIVAEGVEACSELSIVREMGIRYVQGYLIGKPAAIPGRQPLPEAEACMASSVVPVYPAGGAFLTGRARAEKLLVAAPFVDVATPSEEALDLFLQHPELHAVAVLDQKVPVGILHRHSMLNRFVQVYSRELFGKKPCRKIMEPDPLVVDKSTYIHDLSELVVRKGRQAFTDGFVITDQGDYLGMGSGFDLMRELTEMQILAARYANPLTSLPGNVPIQEHTERLLHGGASFVVAYCDLDQFKPYNDIYGFRRGDEIIRLVARLLTEEANADLDFVGHIGGDDFMVMFQSPDWEARCQRVVARFDVERLPFFSADHAEAGGYQSEDRRGSIEFHRLVSLSIGAVAIDPTNYHQQQEVASAATEAKKQAKRIVGSCLFLDQRRQPFVRRTPVKACATEEE